MSRYRRNYISEEKYDKKYRNAKKFRPGEILPEDKVRQCERCGTPYYITSGSTAKQGNYRARAVKTDAGYVALPFKVHNPDMIGFPGIAERKDPDGTVTQVKTDCFRARHEPGFIESQDKELLDSIKALPTAPEKTATSPTPATQTPASSKGFTNKFAGNCVGCGTRVGVGEGLTSRSNLGWEVRCVNCHHGGK